jgi:hypothetical protein
METKRKPWFIARYSMRVPGTTSQYWFDSHFLASVVQSNGGFKRALLSNLEKELREFVIRLKVMFRGVLGGEFGKLDFEISEANDLQRAFDTAPDWLGTFMKPNKIGN